MGKYYKYKKKSEKYFYKKWFMAFVQNFVHLKFYVTLENNL